MPRRRRRKPPVRGVSRAQKRLGEQNETLFPTSPNVYAGSTALATVSFCSPRLSHFARSPTQGRKMSHSRRTFAQPYIPASSAPPETSREILLCKRPISGKHGIRYFQIVGKTLFLLEDKKSDMIATVNYHSSTLLLWSQPTWTNTLPRQYRRRTSGA